MLALPCAFRATCKVGHRIAVVRWGEPWVRSTLLLVASIKCINFIHALFDSFCYPCTTTVVLIVYKYSPLLVVTYLAFPAGTRLLVLCMYPFPLFFAYIYEVHRVYIFWCFIPFFFYVSLFFDVFLSFYLFVSLFLPLFFSGQFSHFFAIFSQKKYSELSSSWRNKSEIKQK